MADYDTLYDLVSSFSKRGEMPCLLHLTKEGMRSVHYPELSRKVLELARGLQARGIRKGDRLALLSEVRFEAIVAILGTISAGAVIVPLDVQTGKDNLKRILEDCDPRFVFTTSRYQGRLEAVESRQEIILLDGDESGDKGIEHFSTREGDLPQTGDPDDTAILFYTSGTTGPPKGVPLSHGNIAYQLNTVSKTGLLAETDRALLPLPLHHVYPLVIGVFVPLSLGIAIVVPRSLTGPQVARAIGEGKATVVIGVPRLYSALVSGIQSRMGSDSRFGSLLFSSLIQISIFCRKRLGIYIGKKLFWFLHKRFGPQLRIVASGGSPLDPELAWKLEGLGWKVAIGYGLTETSPLLTINPPGDARIGTVGRVIQGTELRIEEKEEGDGGSGPGGEILVRGPGVFS
ncbi:MAG: AMP-binding protein [Desulfovibrionales bacterium]